MSTNNNEFSLVASENTTPAVMEDNNNFIHDLTAPAEACYCSVTANTPAEKIALYNATNAPTDRLKSMINKPIKVKDVFVEVVTCINKDTGEVKKCPRTVLIDDKGKSYTAVSLGVFSALRKIFSIFGEPTEWDKPLTITPIGVQKDKYEILTLSL